MTAIEDLPVTTTVRAACPHDCPDTCAMLVTVTDGRATEVRGDPEHPFTRGGLCVKVNNYVDKVYSPDRLLHPMRRTGPKGSGRFNRISWDDALEEIATRFRGAVADHGPEAIMPVSYLGTEGILNGLNVGDPFFNRLGATISERTYCDSGACTAYTMTIGATAGVDPESLVHSRYILIWACNMVSTNLHLWPVVAEAQRRGGVAGRARSSSMPSRARPSPSTTRSRYTRSSTASPPRPRFSRASRKSDGVPTARGGKWYPSTFKAALTARTPQHSVRSGSNGPTQ